MILCSAEPRIISCLPTHVINLVINDNSLEILYIYIYIYIIYIIDISKTITDKKRIRLNKNILFKS